MVRKKLDFDPTLARYNAPFMDDNDAKNTGGKYRMVPIFERAVSLAVKTKGCGRWSGAGGRLDVSSRHAGDEFEQLVKTGMTTTQALQAGTIVNAGCWAGMVRSARSPKASSPTSSPCRATRPPTSCSSTR